MNLSKSCKKRDIASGVLPKTYVSHGKQLICGPKGLSNPRLNTMKFCNKWLLMSEKRGRKSSGNICPQCKGKKCLYSNTCAKCRRNTAVFKGRAVSQQIWNCSIRDVLRQRDGDGCGYCGIPLQQVVVHLEHIKPKSQGGTDDLDNLLLSCSFCNMAKQDTDVLVFLQWLSHIRSGYFECRAKPIQDILQQTDPSVRDKLQKAWWD